MQTDRWKQVAEHLEWETDGQGLLLALFGNLMPEVERLRLLDVVTRAREALEASATEEALLSHLAQLRDVTRAVADAVQQLIT